MSIIKLFHFYDSRKLMMEEKHHDSAVCELLLILFSVGALICILYRRGIFDLKLPLSGSEEEWIAVLLAIDAFMAGSLLCRLVLPMSTLAFGAVSAVVLSPSLRLERLFEASSYRTCPGSGSDPDWRHPAQH